MGIQSSGIGLGLVGLSGFHEAEAAKVTDDLVPVRWRIHFFSHAHSALAARPTAYLYAQWRHKVDGPTHIVP
jgi:hypothetical protein